MTLTDLAMGCRVTVLGRVSSQWEGLGAYVGKNRASYALLVAGGIRFMLGRDLDQNDAPPRSPEHCRSMFQPVPVAVMPRVHFGEEG